MTDLEEEMKELITKGVEKAIEKAKEAVRQSVAEWVKERQNKAAKLMGLQRSQLPNEYKGEESDNGEEITHSKETYSDVSKLLTEVPALQVFDEKPNRVFVQKAPLSISKGTNHLICLPNLYWNALKTQCHIVMACKLHENEYGKIDNNSVDKFKNMSNATLVFGLSSAVTELSIAKFNSAKSYFCVSLLGGVFLKMLTGGLTCGSLVLNQLYTVDVFNSLSGISKPHTITRYTAKKLLSLKEQKAGDLIGEVAKPEQMGNRSKHLKETLVKGGWEVFKACAGISMVAKPSAYFGKTIKLMKDGKEWEAKIDDSNIREAMLRAPGLCINGAVLFVKLFVKLNLFREIAYILGELVCVIREVKFFSSTGDAIWCLLVCDMSVSLACAMESDSFGSFLGDGVPNGTESAPAQSQEIDTYVFQMKYFLAYEQQIDLGQSQKMAEECWNGGGDGIVTATSMSYGDTCIRGYRFVPEESVTTPLEVYLDLQNRSYIVDYDRVPITDEKSPKEQDFDILVQRILQADIETKIIFNCQMGRGRTTTGMVIATLIYLNRIGSSDIRRTSSLGTVSDCASSVADKLPNSEEVVSRGEYTVIRSLIRVLEGGVEGKRLVDKVIDKCSSMQNLREAISTYRNSVLRQSDEMKRAALLSFFVEYLERYYYLICFSVYLYTERVAFDSGSSSHCSFYEWMKSRPELYTIIQRLLRRDPMGALGYARTKPSLLKIPESAKIHPSDMETIACLRKGEVLGSQTVLKSDHCPGCQRPSLPERVEGAPNFREIPGFPVYGVANPTVDGILSVIRRIGSSKGGRQVFWHNMREEPVIYINGKPFVLREVERPYKNMLEYRGIDRHRVEGMEARLKDDILREAERYHGAIMVIHENDDGQIFDGWEHVSPEVVMTPLEVFRGLQAEGFPVKYARVPITDGKAPRSSDFDTLAINIASACKNTALVFNCQMGCGRTTTGTVIACLLKLRIDYGRPIKMLPDDFSHKEADSDLSSGEEADDHCQESLSTPVKGRTEKEASHNFGINDILLLWKITTLFENGVNCREALDAVIDRCSALQNIRQAVLQYRKIFNQQQDEPRERRVALNRGAEYLERYFRLIAFAAYLGSEAFDGFCEKGVSKISFKNWFHRRPEIQAMKWSIRLQPGRFFTVPEKLRTPHEFQHGDAVMEATVKDRCGSVLGKGSILKMYFFPGQRTSSNIQIHGAPHVFKVDGYPLYSMATPTIGGAKETLSYLGAKPIVEGSIVERVIITDLREEAVVYINGTPFVLRELNKPVDTLKHVGITGPAVEHMEARLKEDIISEVRQSGGRMLLHREEFNPALNQVSIIGYWENIFVDDVKTPSEVYASLEKDGFNITYRRIPLAREREALTSDVDAVQYCMDHSAGSYLFVSHTGFGGVAYAMAIICIRLEAEGKLPSNIPRSHVGPSHLSTEDAHRIGDYRDILSVIRVLIRGPESKTEVDSVIDRCAGAGHLRDDILHYSKELEKLPIGDDEHQAYLMHEGVKALRRYFYLITYRSYLYCTSAAETSFTAWMDARPELGHLCSNLKLV